MRLPNPEVDPKGASRETEPESVDIWNPDEL